MTAAEKIQKAKMSMILPPISDRGLMPTNTVFFASVMMNLAWMEDTTIPTACTNGQWVKWNPVFTDSLSVVETVFVIAHEVMHCVLMHHLRRGHRDPVKWNRAADYVINLILVESGFKMPQGGLLDTKYKDMSAEEIYKLLPDDEEGGRDFGQVVDGDFEDEPGKHDLEERMKQVISQSAAVAKQAGRMPSFLDKLIKELLEAKVPWQEVLARFVSDTDKSDYSFSRPNRRFLSTGFILPSLYRETVGNLILVVDSSGSTWNDNTLTRFASEVQGILGTFNKGFLVLYVDTELHEPQYIEPDEDVELKIQGGGGTSFRPAFEYIANEGLEPTAVVYLTDGYCNDFPDDVPGYPVLWVLERKNPSFDTPFGETIVID